MCTAVGWIDEMLKLIGVCAMAAGTLLVCRELADKRKKRLFLCEEFYRFVSHIRLQISCFLRPVSELAEGFRSDILSEIGFLPSIAEQGIFGAFESVCERISLSEEEKRILGGLFSSLGTGYMENEIKQIDAYSAELYRLLENERADLPKRSRLVNTLLTAASLGIIILLI